MRAHTHRDLPAPTPNTLDKKVHIFNFPPQCLPVWISNGLGVINSFELWGFDEGHFILSALNASVHSPVKRWINKCTNKIRSQLSL